MIEFSIEVIETAIVIAAMIVLRLLSRSSISRALRRFNFSTQRRKMTVKLINFSVIMLGILIISAIWGIEQGELLIFLSSAITVFGIAFFANWSLLSNITSGLILFFNHPVKLGDTIRIHDKESPMEGKVVNIGYYFLLLETPDGQKVTIPNSLLLQKMVSVVSN